MRTPQLQITAPVSTRERVPRLRFTVITPGLSGRSAFLAEAIASVRASLRAPLDFDVEHLVREEASPGRPGRGRRDVPLSDGIGLRVWRQREHLGPGAARNRLLQECAPDSWIVPLDDDDLLLQRTLHHYADLILHHPERRWFVADFARMDAARRYLPGQDYAAWTFQTPTAMLTSIFQARHFLQGNVCFHQGLIQEVGGYDETLEMAEDLDLYVRFLLAGHLPWRGTHLSHLHRVHEGNISRGVDARTHHEDLERLYRRHAPRLEALGVPTP
ncbi:MAG: glycosyltransferase [Myxococcaceae bacterium]|nr:MAG: glycosyltransferase [Myxococcaceae bacterium]